MNVAQETLGFRRAGLSPALSLLMSAFALPISPAALSSHLHRLTERSSTTVSTPSTSLPARSPQWLCDPPGKAGRDSKATKVCEPDAALRGPRKGHKPSIEASGPNQPRVASLSERDRVDQNDFEGVLTIRSFGYRLEPRYIFRAGRLDQ